MCVPGGQQRACAHQHPWGEPHTPQKAQALAGSLAVPAASASDSLSAGSSPRRGGCLTVGELTLPALKPGETVVGDSAHFSPAPPCRSLPSTICDCSQRAQCYPSSQELGLQRLVTVHGRVGFSTLRGVEGGDRIGSLGACYHPSLWASDMG